MKVFISGVAGFLGSHLADAFLADGHQVIGCDNLLGGEIDNVPDDVEFYQYDCCHHNLMRKITQGCDIVYHCAATAYEGLSVVSPHVVTQNIVTASVSLFSAAIANKAKRIISCSSMVRYGSNAIPFTEDMALMPQDPYGIGKVAAEGILRNLCEVHGAEFVVAVPHNIIGPRQKYNDPYRNVASIMINLMLQGREPIIYGDGEQKRCFSFVRDYVYCLKEMAYRDNLVGQTINIGPDEEFVSINKLAYTIAGLLNFDVSPIYVDPRPQEVKLAICSANKAREMLDYRTTMNLTNGLQEMIDDIVNCGTRRFRYHFDPEMGNEKIPKTRQNKLFWTHLEAVA